MSNVVLSEETYSYDAAGNVTDAPNSCFHYDPNCGLSHISQKTSNGITITFDYGEYLIEFIL